MSGELYELLRSFLLVLVGVGVPLLAPVLLAGILSAFLQKVLGIRDDSLSYGIKLLALLVVIYMQSSQFSRLFKELAVRALR